MQIDIDLLYSYGATTKKYRKGEYIFEQGQTPQYYYQIIEGEVKVFCINEECHELIHGIFKEGFSMGEPPLFINKPYPSTSKALKDSIIIRLSKSKFMTMLHEETSVALDLLHTLCYRIYGKAETAQILISHSSEEKILGFLHNFKQDDENKGPKLIPYTRQQIADLTGLRVETVIRTLLKLAKSNKVKIINHKVYY